MTHHRHGSVQPGDKGDVVRGYEFVGDRLILRPVGTAHGSDAGNGSSDDGIEDCEIMDVLMPQLGETVAEGKITKWFVRPARRSSRATTCSRSRPTRSRWKCPRPRPACCPKSASRRAKWRRSAPWSRVIADGSGAAAVSASRAPPPVRKARTRRRRRSQRRVAGQRSRGNRAPIKLDPFFEVRTPERNFGPARLPAASP